MTRPYQVLFLCTGNSARSILAEALLNHLGRGRFVAHSAGSFPNGRVHPLALATLQQHGMDEFALPGEHRSMDLVITVCDNATGESCPIWPGHPAAAHWGVPDPAAVEGSEERRRKAFRQAFDTLRARIEGLIALPIDTFGHEALRQRLRELGQLQAGAVSA
jgi:arsenate reductase (thioredoxin)